MGSKRKKFWGNHPKFKVPKYTKTAANRFQVFSDLEDEEVSSLENQVVEDKIKVPPIVVDKSHSFTTVIGLAGKNCKYKRISIGTKITPNALDDYEEIVKKLNDKKMHFFTHPIKDNRQFKLMLFGLPQLSTETIKKEFKEAFNVELVNIKEIVTTRSNIDDALYMVEFNRDQVTKREVMKIKHIYGIVVQWRNPHRRSRGPTQCSKCAMYGHGSANCFRAAACISCGGSHDYSVCQLNKIQIEGPVLYKCFNCVKRNLKNVNHRADDPHCPSRREYLEIRKRVTYIRRPTKLQLPKNVNTYSSDEELESRYNETPRITTGIAGKSENKVTYASVTKSSNRIMQEENLSNEQLLNIYFEALDALEKCKTKYDKLRVLGNMLKYAIY